MSHDQEQSSITLIPEQSPEEAVRVSLGVARRWKYFEPLLSGRWGDVNELTVPLSAQQLRTWYSVVTQTSYDFEFNYPLGASCASLIHYNLVAPVVDYFIPTSDDWLLYTLIDEQVPEDKRRDLYVRQGRRLRDMFLSYDLSYVNYITSSDPVYLHWNDEDEDKRQAWLNNDNYSILTSILHNGYLVSDVKLMPRKPVVPWYNVNRKEIIKYVPQPNLFLSFELQELYGPAPDDESEEDRLRELEFKGEGGPSFEDYVLADMTPPSPLKPVFKLPYMGYMRFSYQYPVKLSILPDKTILTTSAPRVMELYDKFAPALLRHGTVYERVLNSGVYVLLKAYIVFLGQDTLLNCWPTFSQLPKLEDSYMTTAQLVRSMTVQALTMGNMLHAHDTPRGKYAVYKSEYKKVIQYFLDTLGSVVLTEIAILLMEFHKETGSKDDRLLSFAELVHASLPAEPTRATKMP